MIEVNAQNAADTAVAVKRGELPVPAATLAEALSRVYAEVGYVQKDSKMEAGPARYRYASEAAFIAALRPAMSKNGITIRPTDMQVVSNESFQRANGGSAHRVVIKVTYEFLHISGDARTAVAFGEGIDSGDKAFNKAQTGALKYVLRQSFCVETGDDPDDTPSHEQERQPVRQQQAAAAKSNPALVARIVQDMAKCRTWQEKVALFDRVTAAREAGELADDDLAKVKAAAKETNARLPTPKEHAAAV